jgi:two-component system NtrC family sensor kinase
MGLSSGLRFRDRLAVRLSLAFVGTAALVLALHSALEIRNHRRFLTEAAVRGADLFGDTIRSSTHEHMLAGRKDAAYRIMRTIGVQQGIEKVRIFNKEGRVTFSTDDAEIGRLVDKRAEACDLCHQSGQPLVRPHQTSRARIYRLGGHRVVGMVTPIYNQDSCSAAACHAHPSSQRVLGVVDVGVSLQKADADLAQEARQTILLSLLALAGLVGVAVLSVQRLVAAPVRRMARATRRVAEGDLGGEVPVGTRSELGLLSADFNRMRESLQRAQQEQRGRAEAQVAQAEKLAALGRLSASIAHEINNPLAGILTFAKLLIRDIEERPLDAGLRETALHQLRLVQRESERCSAIVRNLLDFARQRPAKLVHMSLLAVAEEALSLVSHQLELKGLAIERDLQPAPPIQGDSGQLRQAVVNLVLNACDATPAGGRIRLSTGSDAGRARLELSDTGVGIAAEHLARIFDPFFSTKEKGTGLGLSVVYGIVERHGGTIDVSSEPGRGTRFRILLPAAAPAGAA